MHFCWYQFDNLIYRVVCTKKGFVQCAVSITNKLFINVKMITQSKHLKGQLGPPVSNENLSVTKNKHLFNLYQEDLLGPPVSKDKCL